MCAGRGSIDCDAGCGGKNCQGNEELPCSRFGTAGEATLVRAGDRGMRGRGRGVRRACREEEGRRSLERREVDTRPAPWPTLVSGSVSQIDFHASFYFAAQHSVHVMELCVLASGVRLVPTMEQA